MHRRLGYRDLHNRSITLASHRPNPHLRADRSNYDSQDVTSLSAGSSPATIRYAGLVSQRRLLYQDSHHYPRSEYQNRSLSAPEAVPATGPAVEPTSVGDKATEPDHRPPTGSPWIDQRATPTAKLSCVWPTTLRAPASATRRRTPATPIPPSGSHLVITVSGSSWVPARQSLKRRIHSAKHRRFHSVPVRTRPLESSQHPAAG